jgi:hypothetical protein
MRTITIIFVCTTIFILNACSQKFQDKYKATERKECQEIITFFKKNLYRDKKNILRTVMNDFTQYGTDFDTIIKKPFQELFTHSEDNSNCFYSIIKADDFYAILGKPNFTGIHPYYKYSYSIYFISTNYSAAYPKGAINQRGEYDFKRKDGYTPAYYCRRLLIRFRAEDNSIFAIDFI